MAAVGAEPPPKRKNCGNTPSSAMRAYTRGPAITSENTDVEAPVVMTSYGRGALSDAHPLAMIQFALPDLLPKADALQKTVDWLRKDLKAEGSSLKVSDVPATVKELTK